MITLPSETSSNGVDALSYFIAMFQFNVTDAGFKILFDRISALPQQTALHSKNWQWSISIASFKLSAFVL